MPVMLERRLNVREYRTRTGVPALGAWCVNDGGGLAHTAFVPNFYHQDWVALNFAQWMSPRTAWAFDATAAGPLQGA
jgi:hypothetical protein